LGYLQLDSFVSIHVLYSKSILFHSKLQITRIST